MDKELLYANLIAKRRSFRFHELINLSDIEGGKYECNHVEPWAQWMGNLNASILLVGKDFGGTQFIIDHDGECDPTSKSNTRLMHLFNSIGINIGSPEDPNINAPIFFINSIIGIIYTKHKSENDISRTSLKESAIEFIRPLIYIINPKIIITMGREACYGISIALSMKTLNSYKYKFIDLVENGPHFDGRSRIVFPVYHCACRAKDRTFPQQITDWIKIKEKLCTLTTG